MRKESRKQRQKKRQKNIFFLALIFVVMMCSTFLVMFFFSGKEREKSSAKPISSTENLDIAVETSIEMSDETVVVTEVPTTGTSEEPIPSALDDSSLLANAAKVGYGVYYFKDDTYVTNNNNMPMISASVIKVFIMAYIYEKGIDYQTTSSGEALGSLTQRMIQISDNNATNIIIDYLGMEVLNSYFQESGYFDTVLQRKMLDDQARSQGKENYTSLSDTMSFLKKVYQNKEISPYSSMLEIMQGQQIKTKLSKKLSSDITVANKTGELPAVENDIGLVLTERDPFAIVVLSNDVTSSEGMREAIANFSLMSIRE